MPEFKKNVFIFLAGFLITSCSIQKKISRSANQIVLKDSGLSTAHVGISIFEPASNKYWYNYQGDHYFVPASNTKIPTCYAAMKYLGDSLPGIIKWENDTAILIFPTGDPTLLDRDFTNQPVIDYLKSVHKKIYITDLMWKEEALGSGWAWNDYNDDYMAERSPLPVYANMIRWVQEKTNNEPPVVYSIPEVNWEVNFDTAKSKSFYVTRNLCSNSYKIVEGNEKQTEQDIPFVTNGIQTALELLPDTIHKEISIATPEIFQKLLLNRTIHGSFVYSQPTDSLLRITMHRSDNFFAEQSLLMVSSKLLNIMNDRRIIDTLLKTDFKDLPQKPRWVDGSGLSRYNLFSPDDFVFIFNKMKNDFGMKRIETILATGNEGTLKGRFVGDRNYIFAKTGTLSGVVSLSGFLYTRKNKLLIFSVLVNNHNTSATNVRRAVEKFIEGIRDKY